DWDDTTQVQGIWNGERYEVPAYAVDCATGDSLPIAPFGGYGGEVEWWGVERVAGRVFTYTGDAEGNAEFYNETGLRINGDDIVSELFYNADASVALHGVYVGGWAAAPQMSVRVRNTTTGEVLWTREVDTPIASLSFTGDRAFVGLTPEGEEWLGYDYSTDRILVLDGATGELIEEVPTSLSVVYVGG
ncbi:MAG: hypothetical protein HKN24_00370, partial [Acidimicrobiales bacterium]|nr:hypothetical protein [Acidimicrobiales bacterium]